MARSAKEQEVHDSKCNREFQKLDGPRNMELLVKATKNGECFMFWNSGTQNIVRETVFWNKSQTLFLSKKVNPAKIIASKSFGRRFQFSMYSTKSKI
ncbi:hypothetical protein TNCV_163691 [Trichonephila clavipes]|nr:hypothetical protein TNCV_163691 [Trichonephila clavipes]